MNDADDDHSSSVAIAGDVKRPTRRRRTGHPCLPGASSAGSPSYLVLLRAGFCLPPVLPRARCALTAPFHPYFDGDPQRVAIGAVCFLCHCPSSCPDRALPGALPCGVRTFLPSTRRKPSRTAIVWLTAKIAFYALTIRLL